jgi:cyanophycin synthetase
MEKNRIKKLLNRVDRIINRNERIRKPIHRLVVKFIVRPSINRLHVPVIAITGTNGKTTITRLLSRIYLNAGYNVGACCTEGVMHNGRMISERDESYALGAWRAAKCKNVDLLVLETARGGIIEYGLGFRKCQVGIVTNLYEDHLGFDGIDTLEEMAEVKSVIPQHTDSEGWIVLNGDDVLVKAMSSKSRAKPIYFVMEADYGQLERVFFLRDNCIWKKMGRNEEEVINVKDMPITLGGTQEYNIANVMAVLGAIEGMNKFISLNNDVVRKTLTEFGSSPDDNLRRFHMITYKGERVIICYAKNPECYYREIKLIRNIKDIGDFDNIVGILTSPGNRNEKYFQEISKLVASVCDVFFVRPPKPKYLRGRTGQEIVRLLSTSIPKNRILSEQSLSLPGVIALTKEKLKGKNLFVVFFASAEANIDIPQLFKEVEIKVI